MKDDWKKDPRLDKWKQRCRVWQKTHTASTPMPITEEEHSELEDIFPAELRFMFDELIVIDEPIDGKMMVVAFGNPHYSQRFVVIP